MLSETIPCQGFINHAFNVEERMHLSQLLVTKPMDIETFDDDAHRHLT